MTTPRTRSQDRLGPEPGPEGLGRLTELLERMCTLPARPETFKAPQFDGKGEVNYFIQQFVDVAEANRWEHGAALLHLREALKGAAQECGKSGTVDGVFVSLRARFGITIKEARARLASLKKGHKVSLQEHAAEVERLVEVAYAELPERHRIGMTLDLFQSTLGNAYLQRHLLAVNAQTLEDAVRHGSEFLQIQPNTYGANAHVVSTEELGPDPNVAVIKNQSQPLDAIQKALEKLTRELDALKKDRGVRRFKTGAPSRAERGTSICWGCKKEGHVRSACPTNPWTKREEDHSQGNGRGPQP